VLIDKNTTIPTKKTQVFSTADDNQTAVTIHVVQGERKQANQNKSLGRFDLSDIPPSPRGMPQIEVAFDLDANGILNVSAKDKATGKEQSIVIKASSGLSDDEIERMIKDAEANAAEDKKFEQLVTARNTADGLIHATRKTLADAGDKVDADEKAKIESAIAELEAAMKSDDLAQIESKTRELPEASSGLAQKMYAEQQGAAGASAGAEDAGQAGGSADDAVDAEFEEVKDDK
jgi:molecular chaperone DnaK